MKKPILIPTSNRERKDIRYNIMRIVNNNYDGPKEFEKDILKQLKNINEKIQNFMKTWDVTKESPYIIERI